MKNFSQSVSQLAPEIVDAMSNSASEILDSLSTAVLAFNGQRALLAVNLAAEMLLDMSAKQLAGQRLADCLTDAAELDAALKQVIDSNQPLTAREVTLKLPGHDAMVVDYMINPVSKPGSPVVAVIELVQRDRLMRLVQEERMFQLHSTNRAVLRGVAHEIKNPLGGIRGAAQLLERELPAPELAEYTQIIIEEADRLRALVDRMFGPNQPLHKKAVNIHELLQRVRKLLQAEVPKGLRIMGDYDPSLPDLEADPDQLIQALLNVVRNAVEATDRQGVIILRTRVERNFTIGGQRHRLAVRVDVEDNGPGIPPELIDDIFYPLVTGRADGTGLGLSITQDIVARHGGLIQAESEPGHTVFSLILPLEAGL